MPTTWNTTMDEESSFRVAAWWEKNCSAGIDNLQMNLYNLRINAGLSKASQLNNYETAGLLA